MQQRCQQQGPAMTRDDLLAEQFGHGTADDRVTPPPPPWTEADQARHRAELLAAFGAVAPSPERGR